MRYYFYTLFYLGPLLENVCSEDFSTCSHLDNPGTIWEGHDVSLLPEEGRIWPLDHLKLAQLLHGVNLLWSLVADLHGRKPVVILECKQWYLQGQQEVDWKNVTMTNKKHERHREAVIVAHTPTERHVYTRFQEQTHCVPHLHTRHHTHLPHTLSMSRHVSVTRFLEAWEASIKKNWESGTVRSYSQPLDW